MGWVKREVEAGRLVREDITLTFPNGTTLEIGTWDLAQAVAAACDEEALTSFVESLRDQDPGIESNEVADLDEEDDFEDDEDPE